MGVGSASTGQVNVMLLLMMTLGLSITPSLPLSEPVNLGGTKTQNVTHELVCRICHPL